MAFDYSKVDMHAILKRAYDTMSPKQRTGVGKARASGRCIFDVWMGVGKTFMGLTSGFCFQPQTWLIVCSKNAVGTWKTEINKWYPEFSDPNLFVHVKGQAHERQFDYMRAKPNSNNPGLFFVTSAGSFIRDIDFLIQNGIKFDVISCDEPQKWGLRNERSQGWKAIKAIAQKKYYPLKLLNVMTGSLTSKGVPQLWPYLHLMDPNTFGSKWRFINTFTYVVKGHFGTQIGVPRNTEALAQVTSPYIYRIGEEDAQSELPDIRRTKLYAEMPSNLKQHYETMTEEAYMELGDEIVMASNPLAKFTKLRQFLNCPATFDPSLGAGPIIEAICEKISEQEEIPHYKHNIIFTPFIPAIPHLHQAICTNLKMSPSDVLIMKGGMEPDEIIKCEEIFRKNKETLVLCSVMFAQSFNLETALNPYFVHFDWDQDNNKQAEARGRRKTSDRTRKIISYYGTIRGTILDDVIDILNLKESNNKMTYQDFTKLREKLRAQREAPKGI